MSDAQEIVVSQEKFDEMIKELEHLKTVRRTEIAKNLEYARSLGDLSENAEYQEARDLQAATEERVKKLEELLKNTKILTDGKKKSEVGFNSKVSIKREGSDEMLSQILSRGERIGEGMRNAELGIRHAEFIMNEEMQNEEGNAKSKFRDAD